MEAAQKLPIFAIWTDPRRAIRYYSSKQTHKLEHLMMFLTSFVAAVFYSVLLKSSTPLFLSLIQYYLIAVLFTYVVGGIYTVAARCLKSKGKYRDHRLVMVLTGIASVPFSVVFMAIQIKLLRADLKNLFPDPVWFLIIDIAIIAFVYNISLLLRGMLRK